MFAGHVGVGMALARAERRVNVAVFVVAALGLDALLWMFILLGWETVTIPPDFASTHQPAFVFPFSHGLLAAALWSLLAAVAAFTLCRSRWKTAAVVGAAVFSHWLLDALVHVPELPVAGAQSLKLGLSLWNSMPVALVFEAVLALAGMVLFLRGSALPRGRRWGLGLLAGLLMVFTALGMTIAPPPPSAMAMAASSLATIVLVGLLVWWLGREDRSARQT